MMTSRALAWTLAAALLVGGPAGAALPLRLLVVTGGHDYPTSFYTLFEQEGIVWDHAVSNEEAFRKDLRGRYDAVVLYDTSATLSPEGQGHFHEFVESGGGLVVLHHAIVSYQDSDWYRDLVGGRYLLDAIDGKPGSTYLHDQDLSIRVAAPHPVTRGVAMERIHDETYKGMWIAPTNTILLTTDNPTSDRPVAWVSAYKPARVVYIQIGHGPESHRDAAYRALVKNAVFWVAKRLE